MRFWLWSFSQWTIESCFSYWITPGSRIFFAALQNEILPVHGISVTRHSDSPCKPVRALEWTNHVKGIEKGLRIWRAS